MKQVKPLKQAHTPNTQKGMGDFYGQSKRQPIGYQRKSASMINTPKVNTKKPPKSLA